MPDAGHRLVGDHELRPRGVRAVRVGGHVEDDLAGAPREVERLLRVGVHVADAATVVLRLDHLPIADLARRTGSAMVPLAHALCVEITNPLTMPVPGLMSPTGSFPATRRGSEVAGLRAAVVRGVEGSQEGRAAVRVLGHQPGRRRRRLARCRRSGRGRRRGQWRGGRCRRAGGASLGPRRPWSPVGLERRLFPAIRWARYFCTVAA